MAFPSGSKSTTRTFFSFIDNPAAKLIIVVVFPTPLIPVNINAWAILSLSNAFSIVFNNLKIINDQNIIDSDSRAISFNIYNESGFTQPYTISLNDLENQLFNNIDTTIYINAYDNINFEINANNTEFSSTNIDISIYPFHHQYDTYNNTFQVNLNNINLGDLNEDFDINIQDIIIIIQLILNDEFNYLGDLNMDLELNVIDVVQIVNVILN